jgi:DNA-binding MarR family transcriptional regulator
VPEDGDLICLAPDPQDLLVAETHLAGLDAEAQPPVRCCHHEGLLTVLIAIDSQAPLSQQEVAGRLGVDRTTMVLLIDELENKALVRRRRDPDDRRKNVVVLTDAGRTTLREASASAEAERLFLGPLSGDEATRLRQTLRAIAFPAPARQPASAHRKAP